MDNQTQDQKKPRRSQRLSQSQAQAPAVKDYLPTPVTQQATTATDIDQELTATPPERRSSQLRQHTPTSPEQQQSYSSPPGDTQAFSQFVYPPRAFAEDVEDEAAEGVWGYLLPLDDKAGEALVLRRREGCHEQKDEKDGSSEKKSGRASQKQSKSQKAGREKSYPPSGYLIGRHPECGTCRSSLFIYIFVVDIESIDLVLNIPTISNRHCLIFNENKKGHVVAILEDLSSNGTFVNEAIVGRNKQRELEDGDEVTILDEARFVFRYPRTRDTNGFRQQYRILQQLGKGHFATVYLCAERATGDEYAVKVFERRPGDSQRSQSEALLQEIALLKSVNHPNLLCLKDTFDENDGVYLVLELAPEGELFNLIVAKQKLTEDETRKVFIQLFHGVKYLV